MTYWQDYYHREKIHERHIAKARLRKAERDLTFYTARGWRPPATLLERLDNAFDDVRRCR